MQVPQQTDANSCGCRMLCNIDKLCNHRELETIEEEEMALEGYIIEIMKMLKEKQQNNIRKAEEQRHTNMGKGREQGTEIEEGGITEDTIEIGNKQELREKEQKNG